ncbi:hypothetical protein GCM10010300_56300 [Streptomyces olivaceoviridis]|nr:hypothetical protein GCM10010300_56300 [Streptomyces olivaceoviridis]
MADLSHAARCLDGPGLHLSLRPLDQIRQSHPSPPIPAATDRWPPSHARRAGEARARLRVSGSCPRTRYRQGHRRSGPLARFYPGLERAGSKVGRRPIAEDGTERALDRGSRKHDNGPEASEPRVTCSLPDEQLRDVRRVDGPGRDGGRRVVQLGGSARPRTAVT